MTDFDFEDLQVSGWPEPVSGRAQVEWDPVGETVVVTSIEIKATDSCPRLSFGLRGDLPVTLRAIYEEIESYIIDRHADELDELVPRPRFDPRREWGTYGRRP